MLQAIVIGGGVTGAGILRDLALRGIKAALVEQGDLVHGTSSRYHGLLHSGGRYAVKDPESARECAEENRIVRQIAPFAVEPCGGLFVRLEQDDPAYARQWVTACRDAGIPVEEVDVDRLRREEPLLSESVREAYTVPDASVDGWRLVQGNVAAAEALGARVLTYRRVVGLLMDGPRVVGVRLRNLATGEEERLEAEMVINAAGAWAGQIAAMASVPLSVVADRGVLLVYHGRLTSRVVNRLRKPGNGDIFVPAGSVTLLGTTATPVPDPDNIEVPASEVQELKRLGAEMLPLAAHARVLRAFAGVRPLYGSRSAGNTRELSRTFVVIDHKAEHGIDGLVSIVGGKLTTYRLMAERVVDVAAAHLGVTAPCRTAVEPILPPPDPTALSRVVHVVGTERARAVADRHPAMLPAVAEAMEQPGGAQVVCECEQVTAGELVATARSLTNPSLGDLRRRTRLGMGTCQGGFCGYRAALILAREGIISPDRVPDLVARFQAERWRGVRGGLGGLELRAAELNYALARSQLAMVPLQGSAGDGAAARGALKAGGVADD
ncbi:MAG: anaerobic glycerol-3-phosphate dehydrogenase subunit GlpA [Symbiobacterium sp.]|uniref:anaerobic glycerol-3-phosphate dehydrogenase subunit GlpA n=1 Tax=Symbiobacterium sp. TaxID=1971213 RepID=UPI003463F2B9